MKEKLKNLTPVLGTLILSGYHKFPREEMHWSFDEDIEIKIQSKLTVQKHAQGNKKKFQGKFLTTNPWKNITVLIQKNSMFEIKTGREIVKSCLRSLKTEVF